MSWRHSGVIDLQSAEAMAVELASRDGERANNGALHEEMAADAQLLLSSRRKQHGGYEEIDTEIGRRSPGEI